MMLERTKFWRRQVLERVGHNVMLVPEEMVTRNYLTDSLFNKPFPEGWFSGGKPAAKAMALELEDAFKKLFGFQYVMPVAQGRLAEAMLGKLLVRNGHVVPGSPLFPTTRTHQIFNGATPVEVPIREAFENGSPHPFKGNLDTALLEKTIQSQHPAWVPFICVEPCTNATGGHPLSMENMRAVHAVAKKHRIPIYLDATRLVENAFLIQEREPEFSDSSIWDIVREFCSYADGMTMSASKDFLTPVGGFFATRDHGLYEQSLDLVAGLGSGLSYENKRWLLSALSKPEEVTALVHDRMLLARMLYDALKDSYPVVQPAGGHGVWIDIALWNTEIPPQYHPAEAFLHFLYEEYGIRGAENPPSLRQKELGMNLVRFAVPIIGETRASVQATADDMLKAAAAKGRMGGLVKLSQPPGLTGAFRARFQPIERSKMQA